MNREEIIQNLETLQKEIDISDVLEYNGEEKIELINEINNLKAQLNVRTNCLIEKLANDNFYIDKEEQMNKQSMASHFEEIISLAINEENRNVENIEGYNAIKDYIERSIPIQKAMFDRRIAELEKKINSTTDLEEQEKLKKELHELTISANMQIKMHEQELLKNEQRLEQLERQSDTLAQNRQEAIELRGKYAESFGKEARINIDKKKRDENKLALLESELSAYEIKESVLMFDYKRELEKIITAYKKNEINNQELKEKVIKFINKLELEFFDETYLSIPNSIISSINKTKEAIEQEIKKLEKKTANNDNYRAPKYIVESRNSQLKSLENRVNSILKEKDLHNRENASMGNDIAQIDQYVDELKQERILMDKELLQVGLSIQEQYQNTLIKERESIGQNIGYLENYKETCKRTVDQSDVILDNLDDKYQYYEEMYESLKKVLTKRNDINELKKLRDIQELVVLQATLALLKKRKNNLNQLKISQIISKTFDIDLKEGIPTYTESLDEEKNEAVEETNKDDYSSPLTPTISISPEMLKAFYSKKENNILARKAHKKAFVSDLKTWIKKTSAVAALVVTPIVLTGNNANQDVNTANQVEINSNVSDNIQDVQLTSVFENQEQTTSDVNVSLDDKGTIEGNKLYKQTDEFLEGLENESYDFFQEDNHVQVVDHVDPETKKANDEKIASETARGNYGNGEERKENLEKMGYDYESVQSDVNEIMKEEKAREAAKEAARLANIENNSDPDIVQQVSDSDLYFEDDILNNSDPDIVKKIDEQLKEDAVKAGEQKKADMQSEMERLTNDSSNTMNSEDLAPATNENDNNIAFNVGNGESYVLNGSTGKVEYNPNQRLTTDQLKMKKEIITKMFANNDSNEEIEYLEEEPARRI